LSEAAVHRPRNIALYGGSFDPIHAGHMAVARAAQRRLHLDEIHFVVAGRPPHKRKQVAAPFPHRFAMAALACAGNARFMPSLAEAGEDFSGRSVHYSIDTVRHFRKHLSRRDRLFFILGVDSFLKISLWRNYQALLGACHFIVASRPGFRIDALRRVIPPDLLSPSARHTSRVIHLRKTNVHVLDSVASDASSSEVRRRCRRGQSIRGLVPAAVEEYIHGQGLYR
jgi:nicotinate-nucleotide adenylyltransferase